MIIGATRIRTSSGYKAVLAHVMDPAGNDGVFVARGTEADLAFAVRLARSAESKYCLRHYNINPAGSCSPAELGQIILDISAEFQFDPRTAYVVCHEKRRASGSGAARHWHILVPEVDAITLRVMDSHWMRPRHELISRRAEIRLGHSVTRGRWNTAVLRRLEADGDHKTVAALKAMGLDDQDPGAAAYRSIARRAFERRSHGSHMPILATAVAAAWRQSGAMGEFRTALASQSMRMRHGDTRSWIIEAKTTDTEDWSCLGSLARLVRTRRFDVEARIAKWERMDARLTAEADPLGKRGHLEFPGRDSQSERSPPVRPARADPGRIRSPRSCTGEHQSSASPGPSGPTRGRGGPHRPDADPIGIDRSEIEKAGDENRPNRRRLEGIRLAIGLAAERDIPLFVALLTVGLDHGGGISMRMPEIAGQPLRP